MEKIGYEYFDTAKLNDILADLTAWVKDHGQDRIWDIVVSEDVDGYWTACVYYD